MEQYEQTPQQNTPNPQSAQSNQGNPPLSAPQPPQYQQYPRYIPRERKSRWWIPVVIICVIIGGILALIAGIIAAIGSSFATKPVEVKSRTVLHLKAPGTLEERTTLNILDAILNDGNNSITFFDALTAIKRAKVDDNIVGISIKSGDLKLGAAKASELREALLDFKTSGKFIHAFIETGDERDYLLASVADSIFMPTEGLLEMNGFATKGVFLKGTLDKIGVEYYVQQFEEYKSAAEMFSRTKYSEPAKEEVRVLLEQRSEAFIAAVSQSRALAPDYVRSILHRGVYTPDSLLSLKLIDGVRSEGAFRDGMKALAYKTEKKEANKGEKESKESPAAQSSSSDTSAPAKKSKTDDDNKKLRIVMLNRYIESESFKNAAGDAKPDKENQIAIIAATGTIVSSGDQEDNIVASAFIKQLQRARENKKVKAIILRIDSPGGSVIASDAMWEEIMRTRRVKPVYASMSDVAASGGYYMAMPCDTIIAHQQTITGSIGVIIALPIATTLVNNLGVSLDTIQTSPAAVPYDPALPLTQANREKLFVQSEKIYRRFVSRVAESRKKSYEETRTLAKGRVWTGADAKARGLVDTLGGLYTAINIAKRRIGLDEGTRVVIKHYPESKEPFERLLERFIKDDDDESSSVQSTQSVDADEPSILQMVRAALERRERQKSLSSLPLWSLLPESVQEHLRYLLTLARLASTEPAMVAMPSVPDIR
jgi:protease-4